MYEPEHARAALAEIANGMSVRQASLKFNVPRTTLQDLKRGIYELDSKPGRSSVLTRDEEQATKTFFMELEDLIKKVQYAKEEVLLIGDLNIPMNQKTNKNTK